MTIADSSAFARRAPQRQPTILIVDDEPGIIRILAKMMRGDGLSVLSASSFVSAMAAVLNHPVDVILIDYVLTPQGNGLDLARRLVQIRPEIPFLFLSGNLTTEITVAAVKLGASDVLDKPIAAQALCAAVWTALATSRRPRPIWADVDAVLSHAERLAVLTMRTTFAVNDPTTLDVLTRHVGVSVGTFREWCRLAGRKAHDVRDLARMLRVVARSAGERDRMASLLGTRDHRTMNALLKRSGLTNLPPSAEITPIEFLRRQAFVPPEHEVVRALVGLLEKH